MNRECRNAKNGTINFDEFRLEFAILFSDDDSSSNAKISIEPRVPYSASVCFDANKKIRRFRAFGNRTNLAKIVTEHSRSWHMHGNKPSDSDCRHEWRRC